MKHAVTLVAVGLVGYFIGFYEMKYKVTKAIAEGLIDQAKESK